MFETICTGIAAVVIFGAPGAGKGTISTSIEEKMDAIHISMGDVVRNNADKAQAETISKGILLTDDEVVTMFDKHLAKILENEKKDSINNKIILLDGIPRSKAQAEYISKKFKVLGALHIYVDMCVAKDRLLKRRAIEGRADDNEKAIEARLQANNKVQKDIVDALTSNNIVIERINGNASIETSANDAERFIVKRINC